MSSGLEFPFSPHTSKSSPQPHPTSLFLTNLFSGPAAANSSPDLLCGSGTGCSRDYRLLSGGDRMLRRWGASSGTQTWNARLDPAVGWLPPLPRSPSGTQVNRVSPFSRKDGRQGLMEERKVWGWGWGGKGEGRGEVSEVLVDEMATTTLSWHCPGSKPNSPGTRLRGASLLVSPPRPLWPTFWDKVVTPL